MAEVRFQTWTADGLLRQASFQGLCEDKPASENVEEQPAHQLSGLSKSPGVLALRKVRASSPDRQVLDRPRPTKGDVARYYDSMADWILPQAASRPLSVIRCPERLGEGCFYQPTLRPACRTGWCSTSTLPRTCHSSR